MDTSIDTLVIEIESSAKEASGGIDSLIAKLENLKIKVNENLKAIGRLNSALIQLNANSKGVGTLGNIGKISTPTTATITPEIENVDTSNAVQGLQDVADEAREVSSTVSESANVFDKLGGVATNTGNRLKSALEKGIGVFQKLKNVASSVMGVFGKIGSGIGRIASPFISFFNTLRGNGQASINNMGDAVSSLSKKLRMTTLALLGTRGAFTAIRKAVSEYMAYDTALAQTLQQDWAILGSLIAPILERIINLFSVLVSYIATFIKMLTGVDLVARANKKSLGGVGSSAGGTAKKVKELSDELGNLQKFDDLNVVDFPKDSGGSSGGGGGGAGGAGGIKPLSLPDVDTSALDALFDFIERNDWYGLGMEIARKFNDGIAKIDFVSIEKKARQWAKNMGDLFNGLTDGLDWGLLGQQIAGGLNTVMGFVNTFFDTYNFDHLGQGLAEGINTMVETLHWNDIGQFFANKFQAIIETMYNVVTNVNWKALGKGIATGIDSWFSTINWGMLASGVTKSIQGLLDTITTMLSNVDFGSIADNLSAVFNNLDLSGISTSLSEMLVATFNNLGAFLVQVDWQGLGQQIANFLISIDWKGILISLFNVIGGLIVSLTGLLWGFVKTLVDELWKRFTNWLGSTPLGKELASFFKEGFEMIKSIWNLVEPYFKGVFNAIKLACEPIKDQLSNIFSTAWNLIKIVWDNAGNYFKAIWDTIRNIFSVVKNVLSGNFKDAWDGIKKIVGTWTNYFKSVWENIKGVFATVSNFFGNSFRNGVNAIKNVFGGIVSYFSGIFNSIKKIFTTIGGTIGNAVGKSFSNVINSIVGFAEKTVNGFIRGVNKAINLINDIPGVKIKKLTELSIPRLATGTNQIEVEGLYHLHQGEAVVPKKYNPAINNKAYSENNDKMLRKMDDLLDLLNNMETTNNVYIGNEKVHKSTVRYINREQNIYGTTVV